MDFASLGTLDLPAGDYTINTDTLTIYSTNAPGVPLFTGVADNQSGRADTFNGVWDPDNIPGQLGIPEIAVFTFDGINLQPSAMVTITGTRAIALLSRGDATIGTPLSVDAQPNDFDDTPPAGTYDATPSLPSPGGFAGGTPLLGSGTFFSNQPSDSGYFVAGDGPGAGDSIPKNVSGFESSQGAGAFGGAGLFAQNGEATPAPYGDLTQALQGGSGGGSSVANTVDSGFRAVAITGAGGGGAIEIGASGVLTIDAEVSARGGLLVDPPGVSSILSTGSKPGGGSGGGIRVHGQRVTLNAPLVADGSERFITALNFFGQGQGGGGRIFVLNREADAEFEYVLGSTTPPDPSYFSNLSAVGTDNGVFTVTPALSIVPSGQTASFDSASGQVTVPGPFGGYLAQFLVTNARVLSGGQADIGAGFTNPYNLELAGPTARIIGTGFLLNDGTVNGTGRVEVLFNNRAGGQVNAINDTLTFTRQASGAGGSEINAIHSTIHFEQGYNSAGDLNLINSTITGDLINNGTVALAGTNAFTGTVSGDGTFTGTGTAAFTGVLAPGSSAGLLTFEGDVLIDDTAALAIEIGGTAPGAEHDRVAVNGTLTLGTTSTLDVTLINAFVPGLGDHFAILGFASATGTFGTLNLPALTGSLAWDDSGLYTVGELLVVTTLPGDTDGDGDIDDADLGTAFSNYTGPMGAAGNKSAADGDTDGDGDVDDGDLGAAFSGYTGPLAPVPEPASLTLVALSGLMIARRRQR